jgi:hypothetical protein
MKKTYILLMILTFGVLGIVLSHAQSINCQNYQNQVTQDWTELNAIRQNINADTANLNACENIQTVVNSDVYQQAQQALIANEGVVSNPVSQQVNLGN